MTDNSEATPVYNEPDVPAGVVLTPQEIADDTVGGAGQQFLQIPSRLLKPVGSKSDHQVLSAHRRNGAY